MEILFNVLGWFLFGYGFGYGTRRWPAFRVAALILLGLGLVLVADSGESPPFEQADLWEIPAAWIGMVVGGKREKVER